MRKLMLILVSLVLASATAHAQVTPSDITSLPAASTLTGDEAIPGVQSDAFVKFAPIDLSAYVESQLTSATVIGLFGGCSDPAKFLKADGTCAVPNDAVGVQQSTGTFTITFSSGCNTAPTQTWSYVLTGSVVTLMPQGNVSCTSNANTFEAAAGSIPAALRPVRYVTFNGVQITNGSDSQLGCIRFSPVGTLTLGVNSSSCNGSGWTVGVNKRFLTPSGGDAAAYTYPLN